MSKKQKTDYIYRASLHWRQLRDNSFMPIFFESVEQYGEMKRVSEKRGLEMLKDGSLGKRCITDKLKEYFKKKNIII